MYEEIPKNVFHEKDIFKPARQIRCPYCQNVFQGLTYDDTVKHFKKHMAKKHFERLPEVSPGTGKQ